MMLDVKKVFWFGLCSDSKDAAAFAEAEKTVDEIVKRCNARGADE